MVARNRKSHSLVVWYQGKRIVLEGQTDLTAICDKKVLVLLDEQNLSFTAKDLGFLLQYHQLAKRLRSAAAGAELHLFTATDTCDQAARHQFEKAGYRVYLKTIRRLPPRNGRKRHDSNIDNIFSFWTGNFVKETTCDVVVLGSGDYGLAGELAQAICQRRKRQPVLIMTLS